MKELKVNVRFRQLDISLTTFLLWKQISEMKINKGRTTGIVFVDFEKGYGILPIICFGKHLKVLLWISQNLSNCDASSAMTPGVKSDRCIIRKLCLTTKVYGFGRRNKECSGTRDSFCGVVTNKKLSQDCCFSPTLFIMYINTRVRE